jgi:hypothetical protein
LTIKIHTWMLIYDTKKYYSIAFVIRLKTRDKKTKKNKETFDILNI